ncbi:MAG TPA: nuclear transport factor 2 family protein [Gaiellaceae bacterium]|nr:nuclear transport factor 2 family protein [Gaiellaceae bacterium]
MNVPEWIAAYGQAWEAGDAEAAAALFTADAVYRSHPFREPHVGAHGIRAYWASATSTQAETEVRFGEAVVEGDRAVVEWWTVMRDRGDWITLPGCLLLRFAADARCEELREYWHVEDGRLDPPPGWGR